MAKKKKPKTSYTKILNIGYGVLNPIRDTLSGKNFDSSDASSIDLIKNMKESFYGSNTFAGTGPYVGIVLRDEGMTSEGIADISSWVSGPFSHYIREDGSDVEPGTKGSKGGISKEKVTHLPELKQLRVRIPEIHAALPIPSYLPTLKQRGGDFDPDHRIINQYPVFVAQNSKVSGYSPSPGDLVWVDFQNKNTLEGGIYLGPVNQGSLTTPASSKGTTSVGGPIRAFNKQKCIDEGGTNCEVLAPTLDGYADSILSIRPGKPFLPQGYNLDLVTFIDIELDDSAGKEGTNFKQIGGASGYKQILSSRGTFTTNRPKFLGYGLVQANQLSNTYGNNGVHKLVADRLDALNKFWGHFYRAFIDGEFGNVTAENFKFATPISGAPVNVYSEKFEVCLGAVPATKPFVEISPSKFKKFLESKVSQASLGKKINFTKKTYPGLSNHATGLAIDFKNNGMNPGGNVIGATYYGYDRSTPKAKGRKHIPQYASIGWKFMAKYGWLFGFYAYNTESWHWEVKLPRNSWYTAQPFCGTSVSVKKSRRNGFENVLSNEGATAPVTPDTINQIAKYYQDTFGISYEDALGRAAQAAVELQKTEADQTAPVTLGDIINNEKIVPDEKLRLLYEEELEIAFKGEVPLDMEFPYCIFVQEKESKSPHKEISSFPGAKTMMNKYLSNSGAGIDFSSLSIGSEEQRKSILESLKNAQTEKTNPEKNFFNIRYFNSGRGGIREKSLRDKDTDRTS